MKRPAPPPPWTVESDPEGTFRGPFNRFDLVYTAQMGYWPEGITFRHARTGKQAKYEGGVLYINGRIAARRKSTWTQIAENA